MSAIQSLLRVMTLRDAEAIVLETNKVPTLRRRGQVEALAMPALDAKMLVDFAAPLTATRAVDEWPANVPFVDTDGASYQVTIEKVLPLQSLEPGKYTLRMKVTDKNRNQTLTQAAAFTVN